MNPENQMSEPYRYYIASKTYHAAAWRARQAYGGNIISTWINEAGEGETEDYAELAERCLREIAAADFLVLYCELGEVLKGALIEAGMALALGKEVRCVGDCDSLSRVFKKHQLWSSHSNMYSAVHAELRKLRGLPDEPAKVPEVSEIATKCASECAEVTRYWTPGGIFDARVEAMLNIIEHFFTEATAAKDAEIARLTAELKARDKEIAVLQTWNSNVTRERDRLADELALVRTAIDNSSRQLSEYVCKQGEVQEYEQKISALAAELERAKDVLAKTFYDIMRANDPEGIARPWVEGGNSLKQDEARQLAREALQPQPESEVKPCPKQSHVSTTPSGSNAGGQSDPAPLAESKCNCAVGDYHSPGCPVIRDTGEAKRADLESQLAATSEALRKLDYTHGELAKDAASERQSRQEVQAELEDCRKNRLALTEDVGALRAQLAAVTTERDQWKKQAIGKGEASS